jgi:hypothetical protein
MTTFKNNAKYAELLFTYLDVAIRGDTPLTVQEVLKAFRWRFKGGSLSDASLATRLVPETSGTYYPDATTEVILAQWPNGRDAQALVRLLRERQVQGKLRARGVLARIGSYQVITSCVGSSPEPLEVYTGMKAIYAMFAKVWDWAPKAKTGRTWEQLEGFTAELLLGTCPASKMHPPSVDSNREEFWAMAEQANVPGLMECVLQLKELIRLSGSGAARSMARAMGQEERRRWGEDYIAGHTQGVVVSTVVNSCRYLRHSVGPMVLRVTQECAVYGTGRVRVALSKSDMERLHQLVMSATSALLGTCAQASVGTLAQKRKAAEAVGVAKRNIQRIVDSSRKVPLGEEVLVCKGYRRAYTAHLGWLAGPLCREEAETLKQEAEETASGGVLDVSGFLQDVKSLDAASSLNAAKMFKICPAPDVSPGLAMIDRVKQIGNGNEVDPNMMGMFEEELRTQILRAYIRVAEKRLPLRDEKLRPAWYSEYLTGKYEEVVSAEIHEALKWEGSADMPDISTYDPSHWKDSGLGADDIWSASRKSHLGIKGNMITRLIYDPECPMPGRTELNPEHVIKFFVKAEGHKDPARGIFSSNLTDRQAQSWMEKAVESVARAHPSYMIGQPIDVREARVVELTMPPEKGGWIPLYYSFDISGWSAKMPAEPQRISHKLWGDLFGGHMFRRAHEINEGAYIYLNIEGYRGWFRNTHANLEGFNGKEMTMILVAMLSLSVRRWREKAVAEGVLPQAVAEVTSALLFAYIDDGLSRIDLPREYAVAAFKLYKETVIETFRMCGFSVEVSKCFPSDRFSIFLNEVYLAGRHVVHGVRAAMAIGSEPTERHSSLIERVTSVSTGVRGAVMAGLNPMSAMLLLAYHTFLHLLEWTTERDPVILAIWCLSPRSWGGLGVPNMQQLFVSGSGAAFEEGVSTMQGYARISIPAKRYFERMCKTQLSDRTALGVLTAPLSGRVECGYMVDTRVAVAVRKALQEAMGDGKLSPYAARLLKYSDMPSFGEYAEAIIPLGQTEVLQEQMIDNVSEAHPHSIFSAFARRLEKSMTVMTIVGRELFRQIITDNRVEASQSAEACRARISF